MPVLEELRKREHHSYSSLNTFLNCPLQYAMKYVYKAEPEKTSVYLPFGSAFHGALSWLASRRKNGDYSSEKELTEVFSECWNVECRNAENLTFETRNVKNELDELGRKMVSAYYLGWIDDDIVQVGRAFAVPVLDRYGEPVTDKVLIGEIDLIVNEREQVIVDWKTAARKWSSGQGDYNLQATCFCMACNYLEGKIPPFRFDVVTKTKSPSYEVIRTNRTVDHFHRLAELVRIVEKAVANDVFFPINGSYFCRDCPYSAGCADWHRTRAGTISIAA